MKCTDNGISLAEVPHKKRRLDIQLMLHKCANPTCTVPFRSLREGKLFLAETFPSDLTDSFPGNRRRLRRREHFWLCDACAGHFTLRFDSTVGMMTVPINIERSAPRLLTHATASSMG
jgi:hypothetical protein